MQATQEGSTSQLTKGTANAIERNYKFSQQSNLKLNRFDYIDELCLRR